MPIEKDIGKAYATYYTHITPQIDGPRKPGWLRRLYRLIKWSYLTDRYGYQTGVGKRLARILAKLIYIFPARRRGLDGLARSLQWVPQGRVLDVGCGSGLWLMLMRQLGWRVEGVDFDDQSVSLARQQGLTIHHGSVEQQKFATNSFDAVTLNHVIEHVPDPVRTLTECARILRPGGQLVLSTPSGSALGHRIFKQHWRGLEPPRHLHLFNPASMRALLNQSGFSNASIGIHNSLYIWKETFNLWGQKLGTRRNLLAKSASVIGPYLFAFFEACWLIVEPGAGEALSVKTVKT
jgi:2-polyprenyl-3-methyl-5-hydroxy-6-metoxy-1,4-benzoquinol methylase